MVLAIAVSSLIWHCSQDQRRKDAVPDQGRKIDSAAWKEFHEEQFDFSLRYPTENWNKNEDTSSEFSPKFNFYQDSSRVPLDLPLDHFANINHVSVYPRGIPTEGVFGRTKDLDFHVNMEAAEESRTYVLEGGTPFAAFIKPANPPQSWNESGFIWMRLRIDDLETRCMRAGQEIDIKKCDPLTTDDQIIRSGSVDKDVWEIERAIVNTFEFANEGATSPLISVASPKPGELIESPLKVRGKARGQWYFEATFPVVLTDWDGRIVAETNARAEGDWMTEEFVAFTAVVRFENPHNEGDPQFMRKGNLILRKSNPSGLSAKDDAVEVRVRFK